MNQENKWESRRPPMIANFIVRAVLGMGIIFTVNEFLDYRNIPISVGINVLSFLTSGTLGIPGIVLLYGIMFYQIL